MLPQIRARAFRLRGTLVGVPVILAMFLPPQEFIEDKLVWTVAIAMFMVGLGIRIWAQQHLHFRLRTGKKLTLTGPYQFVRNPIYIGNALICLSLVVASEVFWLLPVTLIICMLTFWLVVGHEESVLANLYGDEYNGYLKRVPRWIPRIRKPRAPIWSAEYLSPSIRVEVYNLLFLIPFIAKELLDNRF